MAKLITHKFVSAIPDGDDTSLVRPSNWNDTHDVSGVAESGANTDITSMTGITGGISSPDYIGFDTTYATPLTAGQLGWDGNNTLAIGMAGGNVIQHIGEDSFFYIKASSAITKGQLIMFTGAVGASGVLTGAPSTGVTDGSYIMGVAAEDIANNGFGLVQCFGELTGVNTNSFNEGDILYYNSAVTGGLTSTFPTSGPIVQIAAVAKKSAGGGVIYIRVSVTQRITAGTGVSVSQTATGATVTNTSPSSGGTVTSVGGTGTVSGISLSGTVTSSGNLTLGGALDLSNPPAIGNTAPNTGKFTTLESTGTGSFGTTNAQYIQAVGNATEPQILAAGSGTNIPLVLQPKGTGAIQAQATTSSATGGNARGANAVDWQMARNNAGYVASGQNSVIGGGTGNTASTFAATVAGGSGNSASNNYSFIGGGSNNTLTGNGASLVGGYSNTSGGFLNFIGGGQLNLGTSASVVTTQAAATNGVTSGSSSVTLAASNAAIKVGQLITGTGMVTWTYVAAISGTSLTLSQNANATGTPTLSFYTPHGVVVGGGNNQATGSYSFIGGGGDAGTAANRNVASGDWSTIGGGAKNTASGNGSFVGGGGYDGATLIGNTASGIGSSVLGGYNNTASAQLSTVLGGRLNTANSIYSTVVGSGFGTTRAIQGYTVFPSSVAPITTTAGLTQAAMLVLGYQTTDATPVVLTSNGSAASTTNQVILPNNSAYLFKCTVISGVTGGGNTSGWKLEGVIKRGANAASTAIVGSVTTTLLAQDAGASTWAVTATADTTNGGLKITFTGQAATTIRTVCKVETTEMTY